MIQSRKNPHNPLHEDCVGSVISMCHPRLHVDKNEFSATSEELRIEYPY
ncbi:hypothetical protein SynA1560_00700 [Synechococcus sp. A15-60]|nr:hypothetical protein SynA1560_00700 [Synechococcus sp. A15-60]